MSKKQGSDRKTIVSRNPATGEVIGEVEAFDENGAREAIERARAAQKRWEAAGLDYRCKMIERFRDVLVRHTEDMCRLITMENGKVLEESLTFEVLPIIDLATYFAKRAKKILAPQKISLHMMRHRRSYIHYRPRGIVLVISPWNFPFSIPTGEIIMALVAGNAVIQKPASLTPLIALETRKYFDEAGLDPDLFQVIPGAGVLGSKMIEMGVQYVNFTGSTAIGRGVSELCGRHFIPCSMELGGKDPAIVLDDADIDLAAGSIVWGAFANSGQVCCSIERVYAHRSVMDTLVEQVVARTQRLRQGNGLEDGVCIGAMTDPGQIDIVEKQVNKAIAAGAKALTGGKRGEGPGQFFAPTVLVDATDEMDVVKDESFGPVLPILAFDTEDEAIRRANNSIYGLTACVYSKNRERARRIAEQLETGTVMINETMFTHACPETPWGGVKESGVGRVHSDQGLRDLCESYHVNEESIALPTSTSPFWQPYSHKKYRSVLRAAQAVFGSGLGQKARSIQDLLTGN
ncbi:MAG: aldehyde dehydrogenase family protein [Deltaproteobacteria bacterium]|nr:aldehyde dehydrogenase family protein [Deltaproteobacteria bacterium]